MTPRERIEAAARTAKQALLRLGVTLQGSREDGQPESLAHAVTRFRDPARRNQPLRPNPAYVTPPRPIAPAPANARTTPRFRALGNNYHVAHIPIAPGTSLYATGEVAGPFRRNGTVTTCWNHDAFGYSDTTPHLYQSHPWVLGVRADGSAFGVFCETTSRCTIDLAAGIKFETFGPTPAIVIIERDHPRDVVRALAELTGTMPLPPRWALGYQQCRWSYHPDARVREIAQGFRDRDIPCDVIWLDIDYMDGFRCFTFDSTQFPDPKGLNDHLHDLGYRAVWMIDPGIKVDPDYFVYQQLTEHGYAVTDKHGAEYHGSVWPGPCAFPDFTSKQVRDWWAGLYKDFMATGIDGVWNDMNEPAVFHVATKTMPESNLHLADDELGGPGAHSLYHNVYGMLMAQATREGIAAANPDKRPFVLTRAGYLGSHRYAATWTGDNLSTWQHLHWSIPMALNLGLSGQPFAGPDIGGFGYLATPELFARWMGIGALLPFARGHTNKYRDPKADGAGIGGDTIMPDHEPWSFGERTEHVCRLAIQRRYRLLPYLYTLFERASRLGDPVAQPLFFEDPADPRLRDAEDSFLLGPDVLVRARTTPDGACNAAMPRGDWRRFEPVPADNTHTITGETDPDLPELFIKAGAIVPLAPIMHYSDERPLDPLTLVIALDEHGKADGVLYEDDGDGFAHTQGHYLRTVYVAESDGRDVTIRIEDQSGTMPRPTRALHIELITKQARTARATGTDGQPITLRLP